MEVRHFDFNMLCALQALFEERHVTRAASRLFVTQPAMSSTLKRLRAHFKDELLIRGSRGLEMTPFAETLVEPVNKAILAAQAALQPVDDFDPLESRRQFVVSTATHTMMLLFPQLMRRLEREAPGISCQARIQLRNRNNDWLMMGSDLTIASREMFSAEYIQRNNLEYAELFKDDFVCVVCKDNKEVGDSLTEEQYYTLPHSLTSTVTPGAAREHPWLIHDRELTVTFQASIPAVTLMVLPGTRMVATVQRSLATYFSQFLPLRIIPLPIVLPKISSIVLWDKRSSSDPALAFMRDIIMDILRKPEIH